MRGPRSIESAPALNAYFNCWIVGYGVFFRLNSYYAEATVVEFFVSDEAEIGYLFVTDAREAGAGDFLVSALPTPGSSCW